MVDEQKIPSEVRKVVDEVIIPHLIGYKVFQRKRILIAILRLSWQRSAHLDQVIADFLDKGGTGGAK